MVERAKQAFQEGVVELWLTSEDLGAYGHDIGITLPELLWQLVRVVPEGCMVRLGMTNPPYIMDHMTVGGDSTLQFYSILDLVVFAGDGGHIASSSRLFIPPRPCAVRQ